MGVLYLGSEQQLEVGNVVMATVMVKVNNDYISAVMDVGV